MAVRVGFEPTEPVKVQRFSRPPDSTALAPHRCFLTLPRGWRVLHSANPADSPRDRASNIYIPAAEISQSAFQPFRYPAPATFPRQPLQSAPTPRGIACETDGI